MNLGRNFVKGSRYRGYAHLHGRCCCICTWSWLSGESVTKQYTMPRRRKYPRLLVSGKLSRCVTNGPVAEVMINIQLRIEEIPWEIASKRSLSDGTFGSTRVD